MEVEEKPQRLNIWWSLVVVVVAGRTFPLVKVVVGVVVVLGRLLVLQLLRALRTPLPLAVVGLPIQHRPALVAKATILFSQQSPQLAAVVAGAVNRPVQRVATVGLAGGQEVTEREPGTHLLSVHRKGIMVAHIRLRVASNLQAAAAALRRLETPMAMVMGAMELLRQFLDHRPITLAAAGVVRTMELRPALQLVRVD